MAMMLEGACSYCKIVDNKWVYKKYKSIFIPLGLLDNEVKWYKRFNDNPFIPSHTPRMIDYSIDTLVLEYVGTPITEGMVDVDLKNQLWEIASFLEYHHCEHCDIAPGNLMVLETNIYIIDFGWSSEMGQSPYDRWKHVDKSYLDGMNPGYRGPNWPDNRYSLSKIYQQFSGNPNDEL